MFEKSFGFVGGACDSFHFTAKVNGNIVVAFPRVFSIAWAKKLMLFRPGQQRNDYIKGH